MASNRSFLSCVGLLTNYLKVAISAVLCQDFERNSYLLFARQAVEQIGAPLQYLRAIVRNLSITRLRRTANEGTDGVDFGTATERMMDNAASPEHKPSACETLACVIAVVSMSYRSVRLKHLNSIISKG